MHTHLFKRKHVCPGQFADIELTEAIKQSILANRIYHVPRPVDPAKVIKQTINYNNTMNNFISNMDTIDKLQRFLKHQNMRPIAFNKHVENTLQHHIEELMEQSNDVHLSSNDILDLVDKVSYISNSKHAQPMEAFNILYDNKMKTVKTCNANGSWNEYLVHKGVQMVMKAIQEAYLEQYEIDLIRKLHKFKYRCRAYQEVQEVLENYYKFLACFELNPIVERMKDRDLLLERWSVEWTACTSQSREKADVYLGIFNKIKDRLLQKDIIALHKRAVEILRHNTKRNVEELNKMVISLFTNDDSFKDVLTSLTTTEDVQEKRDASFYKELYEPDMDSDSD
jgi:hypothetical protein